ncbi:3-hydroxyisobutyrate dehydrogenase-like beta-hydroxyacid dehydrogenase [Labrys wisconsinensis]|uniref:3-hydroxyisobutyrate dehydrogenase-like beta-hydroxyacid dehydrogenase n=1 Tax=Labrys wisconsinensis TaxID=425677 RepID=A0ABU0JCZ2_9HYPH|nr:NAD(P)-dependent oxidoreductase [Labrys wisconsinensis]MDQ0471119.1 3-hydroxyisobutyrate dehydrogenase-like beta-hydroxyacid dehydrogenase [Labrys wisconsinensis]
MTKERIGFVGVGLMGHGMAGNIVDKGFPLTVVGHRNREPVEDLLARGAAEAHSGRELAERSDIVVLCVTGSPQVEAVINGPEGLAAAGKPLLICDSSTSDPSVTIRLAAELAPKGITLIDTPLGRTPKDAAAGTLDVMVGGAPEVVARARPVLEAFAGRVIPTGPVGSGHTMKLLNNFLSMGYAALYAEALTLGVKAGLTPKTFDSVIRGGRMDCGFYQTFFQWVLERDPNAHKFTLSNALKDMTYLAGFANATSTANPMGAAVRNSYALAAGAGRAQDYVPMLSDVVAELNGVSLTGN